MLSNNDLCLAECAKHVTIFSTGSKFQPVSNFTELPALSLVTLGTAYLVHGIIAVISPSSQVTADLEQEMLTRARTASLSRAVR